MELEQNFRLYRPIATHSGAYECNLSKHGDGRSTDGTLALKQLQKLNQITGWPTEIFAARRWTL